MNLLENNAGVTPAVASPGNGGGLHVTGDADVTITGGTVNGNIAASEGGGLWNGAGTLLVTGTQINNNRADGTATDQGGGGVFNAAGFVALHNVQLTGNEADRGAAAFNHQGTLNVHDSDIMNNTSSGLHYLNIDGVLSGNTVSGNADGAVTGLVGTTGDDIVRITSTTIEINGSTLSYDANVDAISIATGDGNDTIAIQSTSLNSPITIDTGDGNDEIHVASDAPDNRGTLNGITGSITILGGTNTQASTVTESVTARTSNVDSLTRSSTTVSGDVLRIIDAASSAPGTYAVSSTSFERTLNTSNVQIAFDGIESLEIHTGLANDTVEINSTFDASIVTIDSGAGNDDVTLNSTGTGSITRLSTQRGRDNVTAASTGQDSILLIDTGDQNDNVQIMDRGNGSGIDARTGHGSDTITIADANVAAAVGSAPSSVLRLDGEADDDTIIINEVFAASIIETRGSDGNDHFTLNATGIASNGTLDRLNDAADSRQLLIDGGDNGHNIRTFYEGIEVNATGEKNEPQIRNQDVGDKITINAASVTSDLDLNYLIVSTGQGVLSTGPNELLDSLDVETLEINSGSGNDSLNIASNILFGIESTQQAIVFNAGGGQDAISVTGTDQDDRITIGSSSSSSVEPIEIGEVEDITVDGGDGDDQLSNRTSVVAMLDGGSGDDILLGGFEIDTLNAASGENLFFGRLEGEIVPQRGEGEVVYDVNGDGRVSAVDPLQVINKLNAADSAAGEATTPPFDTSREYITQFDYADVNADGRVSALDALMIINLLNARDASSEPNTPLAITTQSTPSQTNTADELNTDNGPERDMLSLQLEQKLSVPDLHNHWQESVDRAFETSHNQTPQSESDKDEHRPFWELTDSLH
ncbi:extracellular nuclease [Rhodopirellula sallentina SM41]|uniref:Extracellular nuclease n=1 Tax=Rhodopirellula sallentina SM41 TaxID=1263870 RepID=M5U9E5_9BACT|nr:extracellular nuclease [Rhodopirellula sallentina SM41]